MKRLYVAKIEVYPNGKQCAFVDSYLFDQNALAQPDGCSYMEENGGRSQLVVIHLCETKKRAEDLAAEWNESFRQNETYAFDH